METLLQDARFAVRSLLRTRALALIAVLCFALGIGANTAIFSVVHAVLLHSLPYARPEDLVKLNETYVSRGVRGIASVSPPVYLEWRRRHDLFVDVAAYMPGSSDLGDVAEPERLRSVRVTTNAFSVLGAAPLIGRTFSPSDAPPGAPRVVLISEGLWRRRFGADRSVLGWPITIGGAKYTVVGVMPARFDFPLSALRNDIWIPLDFATVGGVASWDSRALQVVGRLAPGIDSGRAVSALAALSERLGQTVASQRARGVTLTTMLSSIVGRFRPALLLLLGTVGVVLLIACANVANLLLARGETRRREFAVRVSLGATRLRIVRQVVTETIVLAAAGGALGLVVAWQATRAFSRLAASVLPRSDNIAIDSRVLVFTLAFRSSRVSPSG